MLEPSEAAFVPREELEVVEGLVFPSDRLPGHFEPDESVIVFAPVVSSQRGLKRGAFKGLNAGESRARIRFELGAPVLYRGRDSGNYDPRNFSIGLREPFLMKEVEFERLCGNRDLVNQWVDGLNGYGEHLIKNFIEKVTRGDIVESNPSFRTGIN